MKNTYNKVLENVKILFRGIKICREIDNTYFIQRIVKAISAAVYPFLGIFFSTRIINEIVGERNIEKITLYVVLVLILSLILSWLQEILDAYIMVHQNQWDSKMELYFSKINYNMEFIYLENPDVKLLKNKIKTNQNATYAGLTMILFMITNIVSYVFSLITAVALMVGLFRTVKIQNASRLVQILNSNVAIMIVILLIIAVQIITVYCNNQEMKKEYDEWSKLPESNRLINYYSEMLKDNVGAMDIRIYGQKNLILREIGKWTENPVYIRNISDLKKHYGRLRIVINGLVQIFVSIFIALKIFYGIYAVGYFIQYTSAIENFTSSVTSLIDAVSRIFVNNTFLKDTFEYFDLPKEAEDDDKKISVPKKKDYVFEFKKVNFRYPFSDNDALKSLDLKIETGKKYAIVGMNGGGKSTFIKLLCGLYKTKSGKIYLDGKEVSSYKQTEYRDLFSAVFQDFNLFSFPLGENIACGMTYDKDKVEECLRKVGFDERYQDMEKKLDTILYKVFSDDGVEISGGEAQKIAIARALYKEAPVLIMDEPTSALDPKAELDIYTRLNDIVDDRTVIFVSHRLSSCKFCDEIFVFDEGRLVQKGNHEELLKNVSGKYYEMWNAQAKYYTE